MAKRQKNRQHNGLKTEEQTTQWPKEEEEQTTQWPKDEGQTTQWPKEKVQKDDLQNIHIKLKIK
jgi:hypothetical protein